MNLFVFPRTGTEDTTQAVTSPTELNLKNKALNMIDEKMSQIFSSLDAMEESESQKLDAGSTGSLQINTIIIRPRPNLHTSTFQVISGNRK